LDNLEKKRWLRSYRRSEGRIQRLQEELERWQARAEGLSSAASEAPARGSGEDRLQSAVDRIVEIRQKLQADLVELTDRRLRIRAAVGAVQDELLRAILELYYIDGKSWDEIAREKGYTVRRIQQLHGDALAALDLEKVKSPA